MMTAQAEDVTFARDCPAIQIPYGNEVTIPSGTHGAVTQVLGGNFTVRTDAGYLVRVAGQDADAIGREPLEEEKVDLRAIEQGEDAQKNRILDMLRSVYDPEIPVNIVELGLIYDVSVEPKPDNTLRVEVTMTLTAPGCGMGQVLADDVEARVSGMAGVSEVKVDLVFDPPWTQERMSEAAKLRLGMI